MLPSMPILFTRESQDAFGNKIVPSTSYSNQNFVPAPFINPEPPPQKAELNQSLALLTEKGTKKKVLPKNKNDQTKIKDNVLETALVRNYYTKVQSRFSTHPSVPANKFVHFQNILKTFDPNKETPVDLYKKIEELFGDEHKDIVEEFLIFLKPGQAAEVGRFMDHLMLVQMTGFIDLLKRTFARKPTALRKIIRALTTAVNTGNNDILKSSVLPHLRSHPRIAQIFKSLFQDERPQDSDYATGTDVLNESFLTADNGYDIWEFEEEDDKRQKPEAKETLDTMYVHGRVFLQHGRLLRSACVTYPYSKEPYRVHARRLAPTHCPISPPNSDEERCSPKRTTKSNTKIPLKRPKKQLKLPTKNVKDVNDNTKLKDVSSVMSPKSNKKQNPVKSKGKKETEVRDTSIQKRDRKDSKNNVSQKKNEEPKAKQPKLDNALKFNPKIVDVQNIQCEKNWTRDEDKTMLQVLKVEAGSEQVFGRIRELLPHRSPTEINERFCHVMNLLQQMAAVGEVT